MPQRLVRPARTLAIGKLSRTQPECVLEAARRPDARQREGGMRSRSETISLLADVARQVQQALRRRSVRADDRARQGRSEPACETRARSLADTQASAKVALPRYEDDGRDREAGSMRENVPGELSLHGAACILVQARERGSDAHVRRRRRPRAHESALSSYVSAKACRRQAPVDGLRLRDALRCRTRQPRPDVYGKIGNSGVSHRDGRRR